MTTASYRVNRPDVIDEHFEDEYVIVNLKTGTYYSLNPSGAAIWDILNGGATQDSILTQLGALYNVASSALAPEVERILSEFETEQLIVATPANGATANSGNADTAAPPAQGDVSPGSQLAEFQPPHLEKYDDMRALLLLDPIHQVDTSGWPAAKPMDGAMDAN